MGDSEHLEYTSPRGRDACSAPETTGARSTRPKQIDLNWLLDFMRMELNVMRSAEYETCRVMHRLEYTFPTRVPQTDSRSTRPEREGLLRVALYWYSFSIHDSTPRRLHLSSSTTDRPSPRGRGACSADETDLLAFELVSSSF